MRALSFCGGARLGFWVTLLLSVGFCRCDDKSVEVFGVGECVDCVKNNIKSSHAFSGLRVAIDCKDAKGEFKTRGIGELDNEGKFKVNLPSEIVKENGELKEECFAQLYGASNSPCPTHNGLDSSKIILKSKDNGKQKYGPTGKLAFSPITCTSAFLWPHFKYPPLPKLPPFPSVHPMFKHPWYKPFPHKVYYPPVVFPPLPPKVYKKPLLPPIPIYKPPVYKKPLPPPVPIYKPPVYKKPLLPPIPVYKPPIYKKPLPPPVPVYKPPVYKKPLPPPIPVYKPPIYKKPLPPPVPIYKPPIYKKPLPPPIPVYKPPIYKKPLPPPVPIYEPPVYKKPLPPPIPIYKSPFTPIYKKPCPPIPQLPPYPKFPPIPKITPIYKKPLPPFPKFPPKYYIPPKFGGWPPLPPYSSHP
ncbi:PREDICTED: proline-rich protein 4-like [Nelumbo nucifera]|uniref:Proline-rich protein 4-like n=1 Tax=Nelumbo nucifera TaxID=4432 RepID=A0A1U8AH01_NELNU|nr:PREDICTED: proline-rich protein 4-like [Nelumbo nucifera]